MEIVTAEWYFPVMRRGVAATIGTVLALLAGASVAHASFHLMKVNEVSAGSGADASFVELKMIAAGQNHVSTHKLSVYDQMGSPVDTYTFATDVANSNNQQTILIADTNGPSGADFVWSDLDLGQQLTAGAVCFDEGLPPDCVAWGAGFTGDDVLPGPTTSPIGLDLPTTNSLSRVMFRGCNTLLEEEDDTNASENDFSTSMQTPQPNSVAPTGSPCPNTTITKKPKSKTTDRTPVFEFEGSPAPVLFSCSLDGADFEGCDSPFKPGKLKPGKHKLQVAAIEDGGDASVDGTPDKYSWKIVKKK
jgi:hypothetical protein